MLAHGIHGCYIGYRYQGKFECKRMVQIVTAALFSQSADALASLFSELALWAQAMPPYADALCGAAAAILSVLDERCASLFDGVMQQEPALASLFERRGIASQIGAEPVVRFVEKEEMFDDPFRESESRASDSILRTVLQATDPSTPSKQQVHPDAVSDSPRAHTSSPSTCMSVE